MPIASKQQENAQHSGAVRISAMDIAIRDMTKHDLPRVGELLFNSFNSVAARYGYSPRMQNVKEGASWAWAILRHGPKEIVLAEVDHHIVGVCSLNLRGHYGGIGPVAVDPTFQGCGVGRHMMKALLQRTEGLHAVRLFQESFNPASFSLYYSLRFIPVADLLDLSLSARASSELNRHSDVHQLLPKDLSSVSAYDLKRSKFDRTTDLDYYSKWGKVFVYKRKSSIRGYLACLPGSHSVQFGPLVAEGEEEAAFLYQHALSEFTGHACQTRVMARDYLLVSRLREWGFTLYCLNTLMVKGSWRPGRCVEAFGRFPEGT